MGQLDAAQALLDRWVNHFALHQAPVDERDRGDRRMFVYICFINVAFSLLYAGTSWAIGFTAGAVLMSLGLVFLFCALFYFRATGAFRRTVNWYMANCAFVAVLGCSFFSGGLLSPVTPWFTLVPICTVLLLGLGVDVLVWFGICLALPLAYGVAELQGYHAPQWYDLRYAVLFNLICTAGLVTALFLFALAFNYNSAKAMQQVLDSRKELERMARGQERVAERARILRNMHDGVGSYISSAMRQLQGERQAEPVVPERRMHRAEVLHTLRDALDQLKLSIDSLHLAAGDVTALLANMRYRLGPRFSAMGMDLQWDVDALPVCDSLDASAMAELQFMLFEALSNVLQHAQARTLRIEGHAQPAQQAQGRNCIAVRVVDDGLGFDPGCGRGNGLSVMRERAKTIGATLRVQSEPGRTVVEIGIAV
jgi:signal transduction histidine kinase